MRIFFMGGTDEIGASSILVEAGGRRILVDCGLRQGSRSRDPLPDLALSQQAGGIDAIVVTHAHFDHTGGLPVVHGAYPRAPVFLTGPTRDLLQVLLRDSLKIMGGRASSEGDVPLYPEAAVDSLLALSRGCRYLEPVEVLPGIPVTFFPAGHILGAASVGIESEDGNVLISGDIAVADQRTVPGMLAPRFRADAYLVESTYGDRLHASREAEERRLVETVGQVIAGGGKVLIPAFAIGRAQEVILILRRAVARKWLPPFPLHVDGMVRAVCEIYANHPEWVAPVLRRKIEKRGNPFWGEDDMVRPVRKPEERAAIASGPPCCIVASSGMLTGGPSAFYARELARDEKNMIAITGYQDEESPGRALLELAEGTILEIAIGGERVTVACRVTKYSLSAHADAGEIHGLVDRLAPRDLILVHGEGESREALAGRVGSCARDGVYLPRMGEDLRFRYRRSRRPARDRDAAHRGDGPGQPGGSGTADPGRGERPGTSRDDAAAPGPELLERIRLATLHEPPTRVYDITHIARRFTGRLLEGPALDRLRELLRAPDSPLVPDDRRPYMFRKRRAGDAAAGSSGEPARTPEGRLEEAPVLAAVDRLLGPGSGLLRRGADRERWQILLTFVFPDGIREIHRETFEALERETGWTIAVNPESHHGSLVTAAREALPAGWDSGKSPSIHREERRVVVHLPADIPLDPGLASPAREAFRERTGWNLDFKHLTRTMPAPGSESSPGIPAAPGSPVEINQAYAVIRDRFRSHPDLFRKAGLRNDGASPCIEVTFISRPVGERFQERLHDLSRELGWTLRINPRPDQSRILEIVRASLPASWVLQKGPGLDVGRSRILLRLGAPVDRADLERFSTSMEERTGFSVTLEGASAR